MFSLLYGLWKYLFRKDEFFVLIIGLDNAGKTTFLEKTQITFNPDYKGMPFDKITTTVGLNMGKVEIGSVRLVFWDLGGQEELQSLWDKYYAESHAVIYVIDSSDPDRLEESRLAFEEMLKSEALYSVPVLVLGNKQDLEGCLSVSDIKKEFNKSSSLIGKKIAISKPLQG
ncbi:putative ADP-ribosylation factor-related protein 1 [Apostichopus japonicus]|uniref:ADP-ribosylation factor-related protein 1 n=1 Tax=Stichopus japonicus TaxID=307972 RepID=A0A2G8JYN9_STIJA|nr:putative ADP-ribosylation factor-related protein 1 [Apostichopus japonicus]